MKNKHKISIIFLIICITGCLPLIEKWDDKRTIARYERKEKAYYDKETPEQKVLREENRLFCRKMATDMYPPILNAGYEINSKRTDKRWAIEKKCMKERGSPLF